MTFDNEELEGDGAGMSSLRDHPAYLQTLALLNSGASPQTVWRDTAAGFNELPEHMRPGPLAMNAVLLAINDKQQTAEENPSSES